MTGEALLERAVTSVVGDAVNVLRCEALEQRSPLIRSETLSMIVERVARRFRDHHGHGGPELEIPMPSDAQVLGLLEAECRRWHEVRLEGGRVVFDVAVPPSPFG